MNRIIALLLVIGLCTGAYSQESEEIEALLEKHKEASTDQEKLESNIEISKQYFIEGNQAGKEYAQKAVDLAIKLDDSENLAAAYTQLGKSISSLDGKFPEGIQYFEKALEVYQKANLERGVMASYNNLAINYGMKGDDDKALEYLHLCIESSVKLKDSIMSSKVYYNVGNIYMRRVNDSLAIKYYKESESYLTSKSSPSRFGKLYIALATSYAGLVQDDLALEYVNKTKPIIPEVKGFYDKHIMMCQVANIYVALGHANLALPYAEEAYQGFSDMKHVEGIMTATMILCEVYNSLNMTEESIKVALQGVEMAKTTQSTYKQIDFYSKLSRFYFKIDSTDLGVEYLQLQHHIEDSLFTLDKEAIIAEIRTKYETEKKEQELIAKDNRLKLLEKEKKITQQRWYLIGVIAFAVAVLVFLLINQSRVKHKRDKLEVERKLKERNIELERFSNQLIAKSNLVEELTAQLEHSEVHNRKEIEEKIREASSLKILTEEDWVYFKNLFAEIHFAYNKLINKIEPKLSEAEKRLLMLEKLGFGQKHMANTLGVQPNTIRVTRSRLRKKLDIGTEVNIVKYVEESNS